MRMLITVIVLLFGVVSGAVVERFNSGASSSDTFEHSKRSTKKIAADTSASDSACIATGSQSLDVRKDELETMRADKELSLLQQCKRLEQQGVIGNLVELIQAIESGKRVADQQALFDYVFEQALAMSKDSSLNSNNNELFFQTLLKSDRVADIFMDKLELMVQRHDRRRLALSMVNYSEYDDQTRINLERLILERIKRGQEPAFWLKNLAHTSPRSKGTTNYLLSYIQQTSDPEQVSGAIAASAQALYAYDIGSLRSDQREQILDIYSKYYNDSDASVRAAALKSFVAIHPENYVDVIMNGLLDDSPKVNMSAVEVVMLETFNNEQIENEFINLIKNQDKHDVVRFNAYRFAQSRGLASEDDLPDWRKVKERVEYRLKNDPRVFDEIR